MLYIAEAFSAMIETDTQCDDDHNCCVLLLQCLRFAGVMCHTSGRDRQTSSSRDHDTRCLPFQHGMTIREIFRTCSSSTYHLFLPNFDIFPLQSAMFWKGMK